MGQKHGQVTTDWADGTYTFRLGLGEIEELEKRHDRSVFQIYFALHDREARLVEIMDVLRLGLIGGEMPPADALHLVRTYVDQRPLDDNRDVAYAVCMAGLQRVHPVELENASGEEEAAADSSGSTSPATSTAPQPS